MTTTRASYESALNKGHLYSWDQRWEEAISQFEIAIQHAPNKPAAHAGLGMAHLELDHLREALESYKNAARSSKGDAIYLRHVADVQERMDKHLDAAKTYVAMGEMAIKKRQMNDAVNHWHRATLLDPDLLRAHQNLASVYKQKNIIPGAVQEYLAMVRILLKKDDRQQALAVCQLALEIDPRNADVLTAIELIEQGETEIFKEETAVSSSPPPDQIFEHIQTVVPIQDARRMALEQLAAKVFAEDDETDLNKIERDTLLSQALDFQTHNKINEAISAFERALAIGEDSSDAHFNLGLLYQDKLRFEEAVHEFNLTVQDQKYELVSHFALGESHRARGRLPEAIEHFITVLKIVDLETVNHDQADRLIELYEGLADSLITKGEPEQATSFVNALVEFLNQKGWQDKVKEARTRLNTISDTHMMILGDVLTAGTEQVLESLYLSQEYAKRGLVNSAMEETFRAIQLAPNYLPAHIRLAELLSEQGRTEAATVKMVAIADTYRARGDVNGAILSYEKAATTDTLDVAVKSRLIDLLRRHGQIDRALTHY
ncbi:MAG: tetratricopeptide repeat protein, partial [Methylococcales bacterium]|nr:tetratricopeptide repeat protein [Methylococcales bacterium]